MKPIYRIMILFAVFVAALIFFLRISEIFIDKFFSFRSSKIFIDNFLFQKLENPLFLMNASLLLFYFFFFYLKYYFSNALI